MATLQDVDNILASANGQFRGPVYDGVHQCVAWAAFYSGAIGNSNFIPTPNSGGARDAYEVFPAPLNSQYTRIPNDAAFVPQKGDIVVWTGMPGNPYGHIAVANGVGNTSTFQSYDQNWSRGQAVTLITHNYNYVLGVLRPKNLTNAAAPAPQGEPTMNDNDIKTLYRRGLFRLDGSYGPEWVGQPWSKAPQILYSPEGQTWDAQVKALTDKANQADSLKAQVQSQQGQIEKLNAQLTASQANDASDAAQIAKLEEELKNVPNTPHQDPIPPTETPVSDQQAADVVSKKINPIIAFLKLILIGSK